MKAGHQRWVLFICYWEVILCRTLHGGLTNQWYSKILLISICRSFSSVFWTYQRMKHLKYSTLVFLWEINTIISGFLLPTCFLWTWSVGFPSRRHPITLQHIVMLHIWKDKTAIFVLDQTFKAAFSGLGADKFWYSYLKWEDCKDMLSQLILNVKMEASVYIFPVWLRFQKSGKEI